MYSRRLSTKFLFLKQKTAYEMRISDWSSDVCSSDLSIFVTHDQEEALEVSDEIVIMNKGTVEQSGAPQQIYDEPASPFVYGFLGHVNLFHGRIHKGRLQTGRISLDAPEHHNKIGRASCRARVCQYV